MLDFRFVFAFYQPSICLILCAIRVGRDALSARGEQLLRKPFAAKAPIWLQTGPLGARPAAGGVDPSGMAGA